MSDRPNGDSVDQALRKVMSDLAEMARPAPQLGDLYAPVLTLKKDGFKMTSMTLRRAIVAAGLVLLVGAVGFWLLGDGNNSDTITDETPSETIPATTTTSTTTTSGPTSTTTAAEPATTLSAADAAFEALPGWSAQIFGDVKSINFEPAFSFTVDDGWGRLCLPSATVLDLVPASLVVGNPVIQPTAAARLAVLRLGFGSVEETASELAVAAEQFTQVEATEVGGAPALVFEAITPAEQPINFFTNETDSCGLGYRWGEIWRFWIVDVGGETVTLGLYGPLDSFEQVVAETQVVIDSIVWKDLP